jgi:hypothetical protein
MKKLKNESTSLRSKPTALPLPAHPSVGRAELPLRPIDPVAVVRVDPCPSVVKFAKAFIWSVFMKEGMATVSGESPHYSPI